MSAHDPFEIGKLVVLQVRSKSFLFPGGTDVILQFHLITFGSPGLVMMRLRSPSSLVDKVDRLASL